MRDIMLLMILTICVSVNAKPGQAASQDAYPVEIVQQLKHSSMVMGMALSPDGRFVISSGDDGKLKLWDVASGRLVRDFNGGREPVAFLPDSNFVVSSLPGRGLTIWELATGMQVRSFAAHEAEAIAFSPDGSLLLSGGCEKRQVKKNQTRLDLSCAKGSLELFDANTGKLKRTFEVGRGWVRSVAFSPDGSFFLTGHDDKSIRLWNRSTGQEVRRIIGHSSRVMSVKFSLDGSLALSGSCETDVSADPGDNCSKGSMKLWVLSTGKELRSFVGHTGEVWSVVFSADGRLALSGSGDKSLKLWDVATGNELQSFQGHGAQVISVTFSPDAHLAVSGSYDGKVKLWDVTTGKELTEFGGQTSSVNHVIVSPDSHFGLIGSFGNMKLWDLRSGMQLRVLRGHTGRVIPAFLPDGQHVVSVGGDGLKFWDLASGDVLRTVQTPTKWLASVAVSPDAKSVLVGGCRVENEGRCQEGYLGHWDLATGQNIREFTGLTDTSAAAAQNLREFTRLTDTVVAAAFSPDGHLAVAGSCIAWDDFLGRPMCGAGVLYTWDVETGEVSGILGPIPGRDTALSFSADGRFLLSSKFVKTPILWDIASGKAVREFTSSASTIRSASFSPDGKSVVGGSDEGEIIQWDLATGKQLRAIRGHAGSVDTLALSRDGRFIFSGSSDNTARIWDNATGRELSRLFSAPTGDWLSITPYGFFSSSQRDINLVSLVRGLEVYTVGQVHQSLFNPDLVRESLAGDPDGEVKRAAEVMNLDKVIAAGPPPNVAITSHEPGSRSGKDLVTVTARITDRGKGVGRIEWRVNGITAGVTNAPGNAGPALDLSQDLALDPGENRIEVIAYEGRNLLASLPAQTTIVYDGPADRTKPRLFVLAIGINKYVDQGGKYGQFPPLAGSVPDAQAFSAEMEKAGAGQYEKVRITLALDEDATLSKLDEAVTKIASEISPRDTFVLYAAAHGYSLGGNYYMIPQDYQGGGNPEALNTRAIGQERIQEWLAKRVKAKRAVILLDTCESGALTGGYTKSRTEGQVSEAAVGRLHEATGRPVLTAASPGKSAYENYKGHGVFTYALIEALHQGDTNNNGMIEVTELAAHVERRVPELFAELKQNGWLVKGLAVARGIGGDAQTAHFGSTGEDFALIARLP